MVVVEQITKMAMFPVTSVLASDTWRRLSREKV